MFKPFIYFTSNKVPSFILIAALFALSFVSALGQTIIQSKSCFQAWPNTHAKCKGFILCDNSNRYTLVTGTAISAKSCQGWVVWNHARVLREGLALANHAFSTLQAPSGLPLDVSSAWCTCTGVKTTQSTRINSCPTSPIAGADFADSFVLDNNPATSAACLGAGMFWSSAYQTCFEQSEDGCEIADGFWNFSSNNCSETPESPPTNQQDCEAASWFWNPFGDYCQSDPPPQCELFPEVCENGSWSFEWCGCVGYPTPIVVDIAGNGFNLTSPQSGVTFNLNTIGGNEQLAWTSSGSDDAWLVLDRNGNGTIDDGSELFGDITEQPQPPAGEKKNGFRALAEYDKITNGGNADGQIDSGDSVFASLRLWQDSNHNGLSEPSELHTLASKNVAALELDYKYSKKTDSHGNQFSFRAKVKSSQGPQTGRWAWDVYLLRAP